MIYNSNKSACVGPAPNIMALLNLKHYALTVISCACGIVVIQWLKLYDSMIIVHYRSAAGNTALMTLVALRT